MISAKEASLKHDNTHVSGIGLYWKTLSEMLDKAIAEKTKSLVRFVGFQVDYGYLDAVIRKLRALGYVVIEQDSRHVAEYKQTMLLRIEW